MMRFNRKEMRLVHLCDGDIDRYMPQGASKDCAVTDILAMNIFVQQMRDITGEPLPLFHSSTIRWDIPENQTGNFTWVKYPGKTPTKKQPKYGEVLFFICETCAGQIHYQSGKPGKVRLDYWAERMLIGHCKVVRGQLGLWKIENNADCGKKVLWRLGDSLVVEK